MIKLQYFRKYYTLPALRSTLRNGFTLIELLFVISLLAVVSLAVFGTFNNGIKIWQKVNAPALEEDVGVFMSKFTADVRNAFEFTGVDFLGDDESFEFATLVQSHRMKNRTVGKVAYYFDSGEDAVIREKKDYSHLSNDNDGIEEVMLEGVKSMECLYYYFDKEIRRHLWVEEWDQKDKEEIPIAIKIKLEFKDESARKISRTVSMFSGG